MGLDMYLTKRLYVKNWDHQKADERHSVTVTKGGKDLPASLFNPARVKYIVEEVGYWRKANAIHQWFVKHIQGGVDDCRYAYVSQEKLQQLLKDVDTVLDDPTKGPDLIPTQEGFFFGPTEYNEDYLQDLRDTKKVVEDALKDDNAEFEYHSSW